MLWLAAFSFNAATNCKVGFDFDDTLAFSTPSFEAAGEKYSTRAISQSHPDYEKFWTEVNSTPERDIRKPKTFAIAYAADALGCDIVVVTARSGIGREPFIDYWDETFDEIYFTSDKSRIFRHGGYRVFFGDSDSDIEEAQKVGVPGVRIERNPNSSYKAKYNPGSLGEIVIPGTEGPSS